MSDSLRIAVIDDDEDDYVLVQDLLEDLESRNYEVLWFSSFSEGRRALDEGGCDAYLIDYRLGKETGVDLVREATASGRNRAMIILTGQGDDTVDDEAERAGASDYLAKEGISAAVLDRTIRYAVSAVRNRLHAEEQASILRNVHDAVILVAISGNVISWNDGASKIFGLDESEAKGAAFSGFLTRDRGQFVSEVVPSILAGQTTEFQARARSRVGAEAVLSVRACPFPRAEENETVILLCANDISQRIALERKIAEVGEMEQRRIGQDIHDDLCQQLAAITCLAKVLEGRVKEVYETGATGISELGRMITDANARAREIAHGLVPSVVASEGLSGALRRLAESQQAIGLDCDFSVTEAFPHILDSDAVQAYRVAQEAVQNATKHGGATQIKIRLVSESGAVELEIADNGCGLKEPGNEGLGLRGMRYRAEGIGGKVEISPIVPSGCRVNLTFPLRIASGS